MRIRRRNTPVSSARHRSAGLFIAVCALLTAISPPASAQFEPSYFDSILVAGIAIKGNETFDDDILLGNLNTREAPSSFSMRLYRVFGSRFPLAGEPQYFDYQSFRDDIELLRVHYRNNGFFSAMVEGDFSLRTQQLEPTPCPSPELPVAVLPWRRSPGITMLSDFARQLRLGACRYVVEDSAQLRQSVADVRFLIEEGPRSLIDSVNYRNLNNLPADVRTEIFARPLLRPGRPYRAQDVQAERNRVVELLANSGFPRAFSDSVLIERRLSDNNVLVRMNFHHGRRLYFGAVSEEIKGVDELNLARQIIYDRLDFKKGDIFSRAAMYEGETNLNRLGVFSYVAITPEYPDIENSADSLVPITLELVPNKRFELAPALLVNNQLRGITPGAEVSFLMRNVFGGAQSLTTRVNVLGRLLDPKDGTLDISNTYLATSQLRFEQPYLLSNKNSGYISGSYSLVGEKDLARGNILQLVVGAKRYFSQRLLGEVNWTYEISEFTGDAVALLGRGLINIDTTGTINFRNSIRSFSLERDMTDDFFNPSRGYTLKGIFEEAGFLEKLGVSPLPQADEEQDIRSTEYVKLEGLARFFHDLSNNETTILGMKFRLGSIFRYGKSREDDLPVPPNRRYFAGGASSIRGWSERELAADPAAVNFGSNALLEISSEIRWHLFPDAKNWLDGIWFVAFADAGNLWTDIGKLRVEEVALAFGIGLRYNLFFGPIRVDFGLKGYDPLAAHNRWFYEKKLWNEVVSKGVILLGIGHAF